MKQGTVYMITGAAMGIGAAAAEYVVEQGGRVAVCDIDETAGRALCDRLGEHQCTLLVAGFVGQCGNSIIIARGHHQRRGQRHQLHPQILHQFQPVRCI